MTKTYCDCCGTELTKENVHVSWYEISREKYKKDEKTHLRLRQDQGDFCESCVIAAINEPRSKA